jgi:hypothetical protein
MDMNDSSPLGCDMSVNPDSYSPNFLHFVGLDRGRHPGLIKLNHFHLHDLDHRQWAKY